MTNSTSGFLGVVLALAMGTLAWGQATAKPQAKNAGATPSGLQDNRSQPSSPKGDAAIKNGMDSKTTPRLLWVRSKYGGPAKERLAESERLTITEYKKRGVEVVEMQPGDLDRWREGEGKEYAKAHKYLQYVAYGRKVGAHAVGGLAVFELNGEMAEGTGKTPGDYIHGWGIALKGCESNFMFNLEGGDGARAIPMALVEGDPWAIPQLIEARSCESEGKEPDFMAMMSKGKPFLGVMLEGNKISNVVPGSPAETAGLVVGDALHVVAGKEIASINDLVGLMGEKKPGDEVAVEYERDGKRTKKSIKLADRGELQAKNSPDGKPLPALVGKDVDGRDVRLADFKGKVVLLDFWATWCGPCIEEMPLMQLTWENLKDKGLVWVGVSGDSDEEAWRDFVKHNRLGGVQLRNETWGNSLGVASFPTIFLVDRNNIVSCRVRGGSMAQAAAAMLQN